MILCSFCRCFLLEINPICHACRQKLKGALNSNFTLEEPAILFSYSKEIRALLALLRSSYSLIWAKIILEMIEFKKISQLIQERRIEVLVSVPSKLKGIHKNSIASPVSPLLTILSREFQIPFPEHTLFKQGAQNQHERNLCQRRNSVRFIFAKDTAKTFNWEGKTCLLVDDVYTSGISLIQSEKALRELGAKSIYKLCISSRFQ